MWNGFSTIGIITTTIPIREAKLPEAQDEACHPGREEGPRFLEVSFTLHAIHGTGSRQRFPRQ